MARRSSGWTVVKAIARDIDRANRQAQRASIARQKANIRKEARVIREQQKNYDNAKKEVMVE